MIREKNTISTAEEGVPLSLRVQLPAKILPSSLIHRTSSPTGPEKLGLVMGGGSGQVAN